MNLIFVSSTQTEFARIRKELCYFILTDAYLKQYFDVFLFENLPANEQNPQNNYRGKVDESTIYLGIFGKTYGTVDEEGLSATEREFDYATELGKYRTIYLKQLSANTTQASKMTALINKAKRAVTYKNFRTLADLKLAVMQSLMLWQQDQVS